MVGGNTEGWHVRPDDVIRRYLDRDESVIFHKAGGNKYMYRSGNLSHVRTGTRCYAPDDCMPQTRGSLFGGPLELDTIDAMNAHLRELLIQARIISDCILLAATRGQLR